MRWTNEPIPRTPRERFMVPLGTGAWSVPLADWRRRIIGWFEPRTGGEALHEAILGGSGDFADEAAHMLLNGDAPAQDHLVARAPRGYVGGEPQLWRYQPALPEPLAMDEVKKLPQLEQISPELADRCAGERTCLAPRRAGTRPPPSPRSGEVGRSTKALNGARPSRSR